MGICQGILLITFRQRETDDTTNPVYEKSNFKLTLED
jgi:hypothetical protein